MTRELRVLEHRGLVCLIEHRRELEVARELAVHRRGGALEPRPRLGIATANESIEDTHHPSDAPTGVMYASAACVCYI